MSDEAIGWALLATAAVLGMLVGAGIAAGVMSGVTRRRTAERDVARNEATHWLTVYQQAIDRLSSATAAMHAMQLRMSNMMERDPKTGRLRKAEVIL